MYLHFVLVGSGLLVAAQDATEDEEAVEDTIVEDEDDEAEVEEDEPTDLVIVYECYFKSMNWTRSS